MTQSPIAFDNTYIKLPDRLYSLMQPTPVPKPALIRANPELAAQLGIDPEWFASENTVQVFSGNVLAEGSQPIATVYSGHQFGNWNPQLGDGRAILLGEVIATNGQRYDIQLKGSGQTPYSRMGDGRSPLGPVLREYIVSEAMAALGIPTTRSLVAVATGEKVVREQVLPGAILTRVARSHIRVGHFQYFAAREDLEAVRMLADHVIERDFPEVGEADNPYARLLELAITRQANLIVQWQLVGFIHGVMNTDNMLVCGDTIDYGPCAFMDTYHPDTCFSSIDHGKRYAYKNQPPIAHWNLSWLAQSLLPLIDSDMELSVAVAQPILNGFAPQYQAAYTLGLHRKFGFADVSEESSKFVQNFMAHMAQEGVDFTLTFRHLADIVCGSESPQSAVTYQLPDSFEPLLDQWRELLTQQTIDEVKVQQQMYATNPAYIPRNHLVEAAIDTAQSSGDLRPFHRLIDVLAAPFEHHPDNEDLTRPPEPSQVVHQTFCGT